MSEIERLAAVLAHPLSGKPLRVAAEGESLVDPESGDVFIVQDGIPQLLPKVETAPSKSFDYAAHYREDAVVYNYFDPPEGVTEAEERRRLHEYILEQIPAGEGWILDAGCGGGWLAQNMISSGRPIISADIADANPRKVVGLFPAPNHFALVADGNYLPILPGSLDCIIASEIMEHVVDPARFVASLYAAIKSGGRLIITTPYNEFIRHSLCIHCNHNTPHNAHLHSFTEKSIGTFVPQGATAQTSIFGSKILSGLRLLPLLSWLPFGLFKVVDSLLVAISGKRASRLMAVIIKP